MPGAVDLSGGANAGVSAAGASSGSTAGGAGTGVNGMAAQMGQQAAMAALQNPEVQQQLKEQAWSGAQQGWQQAQEVAAQVAHEFRGYVQEGPAGVSVLCFLGGVATMVVGFIGLINFGDIISSPFHYLLHAYLLVFGYVSVVLEADVERLHNLKVIGRLAPFVQHFQMEVFEHAKFLTLLRGRGFFYLFVGTLAATQCLWCLFFLCGLWNMGMGLICLLMSFGINPALHMPEYKGGAQEPLYERVEQGQT
mmetsp:Transcript_56618/g.104805  ORF Transcript_56618/g.104805 Transcript_56618/m.104805 type:complete len:251 (-) Transcript_56618:74-826(-)